MKKKHFSQQTIGLFFSKESQDRRTQIAEALKGQGVKIMTIEDPKEFDRILHDTNPELRPETIVFDSTLMDIETVDALAKAEIQPVNISFLPKGGRVMVTVESRELCAFIQDLLMKELTPA